MVAGGRDLSAVNIRVGRSVAHTSTITIHVAYQSDRECGSCVDSGMHIKWRLFSRPAGTRYQMSAVSNVRCQMSNVSTFLPIRPRARASRGNSRLPPSPLSLLPTSLLSPLTLPIEMAVSGTDHVHVLAVSPGLWRSVPCEDSHGCVPVHVHLDGLRVLRHRRLPCGETDGYKTVGHKRLNWQTGVTRGLVYLYVKRQRATYRMLNSC